MNWLPAAHYCLRMNCNAFTPWGSCMNCRRFTSCWTRMNCLVAFPELVHELHSIRVLEGEHELFKIRALQTVHELHTIHACRRGMNCALHSP
jgi:hypothetical protein